MKKRILAIMGPSGAGKTTLGKNLATRCNYEIPKHCTTREPRIDDEEGFYRYLKHSTYKELYEKGEFLISSGDHSIIKKENGNFYGVLKKDCDTTFEKNDTIILFTSYKDIEQLVRLRQENIQIDIINITFKNIETGVKLRLVGNTTRNHTEKDITSRVRIALLDAKNYEKAIQENASVTIYTDFLNIEETYQEVCKKLILK